VPKHRHALLSPSSTTKPQGKGTGLGLFNGVWGSETKRRNLSGVYSEVGRGTSFKIYLPRVDQPIERAGAVRVATEAPRGTETIVLAEDEKDVREVAREFLESGGYTVIEARDGTEALKRVEKNTMALIHLLVTDMVMPGMTGQGTFPRNCCSAARKFEFSTCRDYSEKAANRFHVRRLPRFDCLPNP